MILALMSLGLQSLTLSLPIGLIPREFRPTPPAPALAAQVDDIARNYHAVGLSVIGYARGGLQFVHHYGYADVERQQPVNDKTVFYMASISKIVTGMALMKLVDEGKISSIDDDISMYMGYRVRNPIYPDKPIKIKYLMTHTSSLSDSGVDQSFWDESNSPNPPSLRELLVPGGRFYNEALWRGSPPGEGFEYSNYDAVIAASIIGKVTGERFDEYVQRRILQPLGIRGGFSLDAVPNIDEVAALYELDADNVPYAVAEDYRGVKPTAVDFSKYRPGTNPTAFGPFGALRTRALGLERIMSVFLNDGVFRGFTWPIEVLSPTSVRAMLKTQWTGDEMDGLYREKGLYVHISDALVPGVKLYGHKGDVTGLLSAMYFDPVKKIGIIYVMNGGSREVGDSHFYGIEQDLFRAVYAYLDR